MHSVVHHHQVVHAANQVAAGHASQLDALPPWAHSPFFLTFAPCFAVLLLLMIWHRINLHRRGEEFTTSKTKPAHLAAYLLLGLGLFYLRNRFPIIPLVMDWPDRHFAYYHAHGFEMWLGFMAACLVARMISALFAALFLRDSGSRGSNGGGGVIGVGIVPGRHTLLPNPPEGYGWFSSPAITRTRTVSRRTFHTDEEE